MASTSEGKKTNADHECKTRIVKDRPVTEKCDSDNQQASNSDAATHTDSYDEREACFTLWCQSDA